MCDFCHAGNFQELDMCTCRRGDGNGKDTDTDTPKDMDMDTDADTDTDSDSDMEMDTDIDMEKILRSFWRRWSDFIYLYVPTWECQARSKLLPIDKYLYVLLRNPTGQKMIIFCCISELG